jgi:hypothetical protein
MNTPTIQTADTHIRKTERLIRILEWILFAEFAAAVVVGLVAAAFWVTDAVAQ